MDRTTVAPWRNIHLFDNWPFAQDASLSSDDGLRLPQSLFVDGLLYPAGGGHQLWLRNVSLSDNSINFDFGDASGVLCTGSFDPLSAETHMALVDPFGRPAGVLVMDQIGKDQLQLNAIGSYNFRRSQASLALGAIVPRPEAGLRSLRPDETSDIVHGDIWLVGGRGVILNAEESERSLPGETFDCLDVSINVVGNPLPSVLHCLESNKPYTTRNYLREVLFEDEQGNSHLCSPDEFGRIQIHVSNVDTEETVLRVYAEENTLRIEFAGR